MFASNLEALIPTKAVLAVSKPVIKISLKDGSFLSLVNRKQSTAMVVFGIRILQDSCICGPLQLVLCFVPYASWSEAL